MALTSLMITQLNNSNRAMQKAQVGTLLASLEAGGGTTTPVTPGVVEANKLVQVGTDKNVDVLAIADLKLGTGAGTSVSATAVELNYNDIATLGTGAANKAVVLDGSGNYTYPPGTLTMGGRLASTYIPANHTSSALSAGVYGTPLVDNTMVDNILFSVNYATATNKTTEDSSCMAAFIGVRNTAATANNKIQGLLVSNSLGFNCFDAYAVQGHTTVGAGGVSTKNANAHITGLSGKTLLTGAVGQGWVTGVLAIIDGTGAVTGLCHGIASQVEATVTANVVDAIYFAGADQDVVSAFEFMGTAHMPIIFKFNAIAGGVVANALIPAAAPDASTVGADAALVCDIGGTPYYIPMYNTLHA